MEYVKLVFARLVKLVDTSDLKSDSLEEYRFKSDNEYKLKHFKGSQQLCFI